MQKLQILVIDDDLVMQMVLRNALQEQGYEVVVAKNGREGLALAQQHHPALVICDWMMPELDGLEVCRQIRQDHSLSTTFFILLTSKGAVEDKVKGLDSGADDFLSKPIDKSELIASVRAGLRLYQLNHDLNLQKQILEAELAEASEYVKSLLPVTLTGSVEIDTEFIPSSQLGGDSYDFYWLDSDHLAIYLIDTSGHGVGAALHSISILNLLRSQSFDQDKLYSPEAVMAELNQSFQMSEQGGRYLTMWYGVFNKVERKLIYANAGHPNPILAFNTNGYAEMRELKSLNMPIGFFPNVDYVRAEVSVPPHSKLYIFSDGIFEIKLENGKIWGLPKFIELLSSVNKKGLPFSAKSVLDHIQTENLSVTAAEFEDDVSLLQIGFL
jgi:phosphoserine phosphatase RsbU/P